MAQEPFTNEHMERRRMSPEAMRRAAKFRMKYGRIPGSGDNEQQVPGDPDYVSPLRSPILEALSGPQVPRKKRKPLLR